MRYSPKTYAKAFFEAVKGIRSAEKQNAMVKKLIEIAIKNGDGLQLKKIAAYTEKIALEETGKQKIVIEGARPLNRRTNELVKHIARTGDTIEEKINPELIAGVKITINDEKQFDGSLKRKLDKLFRN
jgi:F0F1-type ATP synthase delta subunit